AGAAPLGGTPLSLQAPGRPSSLRFGAETDVGVQHSLHGDTAAPMGFGGHPYRSVFRHEIVLVGVRLPAVVAEHLPAVAVTLLGPRLSIVGQRLSALRDA